MNTVFLGDSFTSGENNDRVSFVDYFSGISRNLGISGTTMGEYSIYPVDGYSLLSVIGKNEKVISNADIIVLEYGINDTSAIMCGFVTMQKVIVSFVKALDWIKQINPNATIYFLSLSNSSDIIQLFAYAQCWYLKNDYFKFYDFDFPASIWRGNYEVLIEKISKMVTVIPMFDYIEWDKHIDVDGMHPNNFGYKLIADTLKEYI